MGAGEGTVNEIIIDSVNVFLQHLTEIRSAIGREEGEDAGTQSFFFRGQANATWDITPGIFRDNYLSIESEMIQEAYSRNPAEFRVVDTDFEKLAKLQHYGLPTRLLDVTSNPLVALYFACQPCVDTTDESTLAEMDGVVYYQRAYSKSCMEAEVAILSYLANHGVKKGLTLSDLLRKLCDVHIYTRDAAEECKSRKFQSLIDTLQNQYFVISNFNTERLARQSGSFLFVGKYNVTIDPHDVGKSTIQVATSSVRDAFSYDVFRVPAECKVRILEELDFYNVNEGALFPELEHQMKHIKKIQAHKNVSPVGAFSKVDVARDNEAQEIPIERVASDDEIMLIIDKVLRDSVNAVLFDECKIAIVDNLCIDWYKKETALSKMRVALTNVFLQVPMDRAIAKHNAAKIVENIVTAIRDLSEDGEKTL